MPVSISGDGGITGLELGAFEDVSGTPVDGQILEYNQSSSSWGPANKPQPIPADGFNASVTLTASNSSWSVPSLDTPIVKVTVAGGGGEGGSRGGGSGANGGNSSFSTSTKTLSASGGAGWTSSMSNAPHRLTAGNGGKAGKGVHGWNGPGSNGLGGELVSDYFDMTGQSTANVVIGAAGDGGSDGGPGGAGFVIFEYRAA